MRTMIASKNFRWLITIAAALVVCAATAADLTVIDLHNRTADEMLPVLRPMVGPAVALSGIDYKLFVRGSPADIARIREALAVLDRAPRQLMISVRYAASPQSDTTNLGVAANNGGSQVTLRGGVTTRTATDSNVSSVRVLEGNGAHIATGQSVPMVTAFMTRGNQFTGAIIDYRELTSGFDVLPRVNGNRVMLDIATQQQRAADLGAGSATVQRASTTIAGQLGQWIELGGVTSSSSEQRTTVGIGGAQTLTTQSDQHTIAVKVEQID